MDNKTINDQSRMSGFSKETILNAFKQDSEFILNLLEMIPEPLFYKDSDSRYVYFNQVFLDVVGLTHEELYKRNVYDIMPLSRAKVHDSADKALLDSGQNQVYEAEVRYADGVIHPMEITKVVDRDDQGKIKGFLGLMKDLKARKQEEARAQLTDRMKETFLDINNNITNYRDIKEFFDDVLAKFQELFGNSQQSSILVIDDRNMVRVAAHIGYDSDDIKRLKIPVEDTFIYRENKGHLDHACIINDLTRYFHAKIQPSEPSGIVEYIQSSLEIPIVIEDEVKYIISIDSIKDNIFDDNDLFVANYIRTQFQIVFRVFKLYQSTLHLSRYDTMTGLMNRRYFDDSLKETMEAAKTYNGTFFLLLFDLDRLKLVNDTYGHHAGDRYIIRFSEILTDKMPDNSILGRIGGDEFVAIVFSLEEEELLERIEAMKSDFLDKNIIVGNETVTGEFSYGYKNYERDKITHSELIRAADEEMYKYKHKYRK